MLRAYGTQFAIRPAADPAATARAVMERILAWASQEMARNGVPIQAKLGSVHDFPGLGLRSEFRAVPGASWGSLELKQPDEATGERVRLTRARIAHAGQAVELQLEVLIGHRSRTVAPVLASATQPAVVVDIVRDFDCSVGSQAVDERATHVETPSIKAWVETVLLDPKRRLPAILVTPDLDRTFTVNPDTLAQQTVGIASVYLLEDPNDTYGLTAQVGRMLSCFHGGVRVYYPRLQLTDNPLHHPLYLGARLRAEPNPVRRIAGDLYALASATIADTDTFLEAQRLLREHLTKSIAATRDSTQLQALLVAKDEELAGRDQVIAALREQLEDTQRAFGRYVRGSQGDLAKTPEAPKPTPKTVDQLLDNLASSLPHVTILPSAWKACKGYGTKYHAQVEAVLRCLNAIGAAREAGKGKLNMGVSDWITRYRLTATNLPEFKARESETTWSTAALRRQRTFAVDGQAVPMQMHFDAGPGDWGDCVQVFWEFGDVVGKKGALVGHVGPHLDISSSAHT